MEASRGRWRLGDARQAARQLSDGPGDARCFEPDSSAPAPTSCAACATASPAGASCCLPPVARERHARRARGRQNRFCGRCRSPAHGPSSRRRSARPPWTGGSASGHAAGDLVGARRDWSRPGAPALRPPAPLGWATGAMGRLWRRRAAGEAAVRTRLVTPPARAPPPSAFTRASTCAANCSASSTA